MILTALLLASQCTPGTPAFERYVAAGICEPAAKPKVSTRPVNETEKSAVKEYFDLILMDGPSTRWEWIENRDGVICGRLNAKNRMGAYTGWHPFLFHGDEGHIVQGYNNAIDYQVLCLGRGS